jgi:hypothetical protein
MVDILPSNHQARDSFASARYHGMHAAIRHIGVRMPHIRADHLACGAEASSYPLVFPVFSPIDHLRSLWQPRCYAPVWGLIVVRPQMTIVEITGWEVGFNKVGCTNIIRSATGLGLVEAKEIADAVLRGETCRFVMPDYRGAHRLAQDLTNLGAVASVSRTTDPG